MQFELEPGLPVKFDFAEFRSPAGQAISRPGRAWLLAVASSRVGGAADGVDRDAGAGASLPLFGGVPSEVLFDQHKAVIAVDYLGIGGRLLETCSELASPRIRAFAFVRVSVFGS